MSDREDTYWWHVGRLLIIDKQIQVIRKSNNNKKLKILNIGCGTGGTIGVLKKHACKLTNVDVSKVAIKFTKRAGHEALLVDGVNLPFTSDEFDLIVAFDVLEHIKSDEQALKEWMRVLKKGGDFLVSVPAFQWLWSGHDVSLDHFRRYTAASLRLKAENAGFRTIRSGYMIMFSFPLVAGFRMISKFKRQSITDESSYVNISKPINHIFISMLRLEANLQRYVRMPIGTSVLARFTKSK